MFSGDADKPSYTQRKVTKVVMAQYSMFTEGEVFFLYEEDIKEKSYPFLDI